MAIALVNTGIFNSGYPPDHIQTVPAPSGLNATMLDVLLGCTTDLGDGSGTMDVGTDGGAYTPIAVGNPPGHQIEAQAAYKVGAASPGNLSITNPSGYPLNCVSARCAFSGVDLITPINVQSSGVTYGADATSGGGGPASVVIPGITTTVANTLACCWLANASAGPFDVVSGWTRIVMEYGAVSTFGTSIAVFTKPMPTAGATGSLTTTWTADNGSIHDPGAEWMGGMFAIAPAAGSTVTNRVRTIFLG